MSDCVTHSARIWIWRGESNGSWHFVTIDGEAAETIRAHEAIRRLEFGPNGGGRRGFGSVKVKARIGDSEWATSVFPSSSHEGYVLPIKLAIRKAEDIAEDDRVEVRLELL